MLVAYLSITDQTRKFVNKLGMETFDINPDSVFTKIEEPFVVVVPTYEKEATGIVDEFLDYEDNHLHLKGVLGGGNRNFDGLFCFTAKDLSAKYKVPVLHMFEFQGSPVDVDTVLKKFKYMETHDVVEEFRSLPVDETN